MFVRKGKVIIFQTTLTLAELDGDHTAGLLVEGAVDLPIRADVDALHDFVPSKVSR